jgi:hypothetical protein
MKDYVLCVYPHPFRSVADIIRYVYKNHMIYMYYTINKARRSAIYEYQFEFVWDPFLLLIEIVESFLNQYVC